MDWENIMLWQEEGILDMVADQSGISTCALARRRILPKIAVHAFMQRYKLYP
jgi:hypothetical protein